MRRAVTLWSTAAAAALIICLFAVAAQATDHSALAARIGPSVVKVTNLAITMGGSGFFVAPNVVLTVFHFTSKASDIEVTLHDGCRVHATVIDEDVANDLALISIPAIGVPITVSRHRPLVGEECLVFGSPLGLNQVVTSGHIAATGYGFAKYRGFLLVDAPTNPGVSGGPLIDMRGELIGVHTLVITKTSNMAMFAPVEKILPLLKRNGIK